MGRHRPAQRRHAHRPGRPLRLARLAAARHDQRRDRGDGAPVLAAGRERGREHGDALERPGAAEDRSGRGRFHPHQCLALRRQLGPARRLARDSRRGRALRPSGRPIRATGAGRRIGRAPARTARRPGRNERRRKELPLAHPGRDGRRRSHLHRRRRSSSPAAPAPRGDLAALAAGSRGVRVERPRERHHGTGLSSGGDRPGLRAGRLHLGDRAAPAGVRDPHLRARAEPVRRPEAAARPCPRSPRRERRRAGPVGRGDQQRGRHDRGRDL